jgi:hypothetical protein
MRFSFLPYRILQLADWFIDLSRSLPRKPVFTKGMVYVLLRMTITPLSFTIDVAPYLREKPVWWLNRKRSSGERLNSQTKITRLAKKSLLVCPHLPGFPPTALPRAAL